MKDEHVIVEVGGETVEIEPEHANFTSHGWLLVRFDDDGTNTTERYPPGRVVRWRTEYESEVDQ